MPYNHTKNIQIEKVVMFNHGKQKEIKPSTDTKTAIKRCLNNIVDQMELIITNDRIQDIKKKYSGIEIVFSDEIEYTLKPIGKKAEFSKIFIPTSGKLKGEIILGDKSSGYSFYPPYASIECNITKIIQKTNINKKRQ